MSTPNNRPRPTQSSGFRVIPGQPTLELRFAEMPATEILQRIRDNGFRWSPKHNAWYATKSPDRTALAEALFPSG